MLPRIMGFGWQEELLIHLRATEHDLVLGDLVQKFLADAILAVGPPAEVEHPPGMGPKANLSRTKGQ